MFVLDETDMLKIMGEITIVELYDLNSKSEYDGNNKFCFSCSSACQNYAKDK